MAESNQSPSSPAVESYTAPQWREEPPTEEGWYWIRYGWQAKNDKGTYDCPIRVTEPYLGGELTAWLNGDPFKLSEIPEPVFWAGPIREPADKAESAG